MSEQGETLSPEIQLGNSAELEDPKAEIFVKKVYDSPRAQSFIHIEVGKTKLNPFENPEEHQAQFIRETFNKDRENIIVVNPAHGNEPYILGVNTALSINEIIRKSGGNEAKIVVPLLYPGRQEKILKEEFGGKKDLIFLDEALGELYKQVLFQNGRFDEHLAKLAENQARIQEGIRDHLTREFHANSLSDGSKRDFSGRDVVMDINAGSRFLATTDSYYLFPTLLSELLEATANSGLPFEANIMATVQKNAADMENAYRKTFLPEIHTFSYNKTYPTEGKTFTPPLKHLATPSEDIPDEAIYVMASGTGAEVDTVAKSAQELGLRVYHSPFVQIEYGTAALPDVIYHPNIVAVFGRMGWGTGWISQQSETPFIVVPYQYPDDPEINFNIKTLKDKRLGVVYEGQKDIVKQALEVTGDIRKINSAIVEKYGTNDGIDYAAGKIVEDFNNRRKNIIPPQA